MRGGASGRDKGGRLREQVAMEKQRRGREKRLRADGLVWMRTEGEQDPLRSARLMRIVCDGGSASSEDLPSVSSLPVGRTRTEHVHASDTGKGA